MGLELGVNKGSEAVSEASALKESGAASKELEVNDIKCESNCEDYSVLAEQRDKVYGAELEEVDILKVTNSGCKELDESECQFVTESSSSFDSSTSATENDAAMSDAEIVSGFNGHYASGEPHSGLGNEFRKRKKLVTSHWRRFVQPLSWRIKWIELQVMQLQFQARKYDKELAGYNHQKFFQLESVRTESFGSKSLPFSNNRPRSKVLKRKKRKRVEDSEDTAVYMSRHNLFSYYERKKPFADGTSLDDDCGPTAIPIEKENGNNGYGANDEHQWFGSRDEHNCSEQILRKIGVLQSQVGQLRSRVDKVLSENAGKFSSTENLNLFLPCNALSSSSRNPSSPKSGGKMAVGSSLASQLMIAPQGAISTRGDGTSIPDVIESTSQSLIGGSISNGEGDILIDNKRMSNLEEVMIHQVEKSCVPEEGPREALPPAVGEPELPVEDQPAPKIRSLSKLSSSKIKKKTRRKARRWSRRSST
ncbi:uncharacterized protein LOC116032444 [Ipomoea triloba]|uniref:uncharacterized protein LOC116032444 n=1 Tax=Ipomoea triloba TaxID=35885 RepID=UPI00125D257F|nr:uncharacterized protein LOC116032444 [Ipomoea triloba]